MIKNLITEKRIIATHLVREELKVQEDDLWEFINQFSSFFFEPTTKEQNIVIKLVNNQDFSKWAVKLGNHADPFVVALAKIHNLTVVTYENPRSTANRIPAACKIFDVKCINFVTFLRQVGFQNE